MSGLQLSLYAFGGDLTGTPVVVDVLDQNLHLVAQEAVVVGGQHYFEVDAGRYGVQALLPSGRSVTDSVAVNEGAPIGHIMDLSEISPHESLQRTVVLKPTAFEALGSLDEPAYRSIWVRLWARIEGIWSVQEWPQPQASWDSDAVRYWFHTRGQQHMLQVGGPQIPWRMVALPAAEHLEVCIRPSGNEAEPRLAITVATDNNVAEALLGYLTIGALGHAEPGQHVRRRSSVRQSGRPSCGSRRWLLPAPNKRSGALASVAPKPRQLDAMDARRRCYPRVAVDPPAAGGPGAVGSGA